MSIKKIIDIIYKETGIDVHSMGELAFSNAANNCMQELSISSLTDYIILLENSWDAREKLIEEIIIPETWFFRDLSAFDELARFTLNTMKPDQPVRILSLPSSTGEEAYSAAITLHEKGLSPDSFLIDAFDISQKNIEHANNGLYRGNSFRKETPDLYITRYFKLYGDQYSIDDKLKSNINFSRLNIFNPQVLAIPDYYDVIFCRNLLIYFNSERKNIAIGKIHRALKNNGLLLIGHSEASIVPADKYTPCNTVRSFGFIKTRNKKPGNYQVKGNPRPFTFKRTLPASPAVKTRVINKRSEIHASPKKKQPDTTNNMEEARNLANIGHYAEALAICSKIDSMSPSAECYTLMGIIHGADNRLEEGEKCLRKALFLEPKNHEALAHLSLLLNQKGDKDNADLLMKRAEKYQARN